MARRLGLAFLVACALMAGGQAAAQSAAERAGELKTWREQCSDPDVDLRLAYVEAALETDDVSIQRICVRQALESDNADIRNLGLRAAVAALDRLAFEVAMPAELADAYKRAGNNDDEVRKIDASAPAKDYRNALQGGLVFVISDASVSSGSLKLSPLVGLNGPDKNYVGGASIVGARLTWSGSAYVGSRTCQLAVELEPGAVLAGQFQCTDRPPFPVRAKLL